MRSPCADRAACFERRVAMQTYAEMVGAQSRVQCEDFTVGVGWPTGWPTLRERARGSWTGGTPSSGHVVICCESV